MDLERLRQKTKDKKFTFKFNLMLLKKGLMSQYMLMLWYKTTKAPQFLASFRLIPLSMLLRPSARSLFSKKTNTITIRPCLKRVLTWKTDRMKRSLLAITWRNPEFS